MCESGCGKQVLKLARQLCVGICRIRIINLGFICGLRAEKQTLLQITIGDLAKFILRKTANLHLGDQSVLKIGKVAFQDSLERQHKLESYMSQDQDIGLSMSDGISNQEASTGAPVDYQNYLNSAIN